VHDDGRASHGCARRPIHVWGPRTVLFNRRDTRATLPCEVQARVRRSTPQPWTRFAGSAGAGGGVSSTVWRRDHDRDAHGRSKTPGVTQGRALMNRLLPRLSREAFSSPTRLPYACRHGCIATAGVRLNLS
jgi:hypothetical protein